VDDRAETELAWDLAELVGLHISERNHTDVYTAIGAGDCYGAIGTLLERIVWVSVPVPFALAARVNDWHHPYAHRADAPRPHELLTTVRSLVDRTDVSSPHSTL
jgi:hypothetical protein